MSFNVTVLGAGFLGIHIAGTLGLHRHKVTVYDINPAQLEQVHKTLQQHKQELVKDGILVGDDISFFPGEIKCTSDLREAMVDADYVTEAIIEKLAVKQSVFKAAQHCKEDCILSTNTLSLDLEEIAIHLTDTVNFVGIRFLHPVYYVPEVEITLAKQTTQDCIQRVQRLIDSIGKVLYFRSGNQPMILSSQQIQSRKQAYKQMISSKQSTGVSSLPDLGPGVVHLAAHMQELKQDQQGGQLDCTVCMDRPRDTLLVPCHHMCLCASCANILQNQGGACPICRQTITQVLKVFSP